jgi:hypothetical protein
MRHVRKSHQRRNWRRSVFSIGANGISALAAGANGVSAASLKANAENSGIIGGEAWRLAIGAGGIGGGMASRHLHGGA